WCPSSGVPGRIARSLSPALSVRQSRSAVERAARDGRGHDGGASQCALAASHAVSSAVQAVDLLYVGAGGTSIYTSCPLERAFRDVHTITQHIGVHPRVMETTGRVLFGLCLSG